MSHTAVRRVAVASFAVNLFCLMTAILITSVLHPPYCVPVDTTPVTPTSIAEETEKIQLPLEMECTSLTVQTMAVYDGPFYEDGTGREVMNVAAVLVYNGSDAIIPYANIQVDTERNQYDFHAYMLPPHSVTLVPEAAAQPYTSDKITNIFAWHTVKQKEIDMQVSIKEQDDVTLHIENHSGRNLHNLTVYYKKFTDGVYIGGKPFVFAVSSLEKDSVFVLSPPYYVSGYSRVLFFEEKTTPPHQFVQTDAEGILITELWKGSPSSGDAGDCQRFQREYPAPKFFLHP